jgi:drug/metabolite transporter (DMT)-like permease
MTYPDPGMSARFSPSQRGIFYMVLAAMFFSSMDAVAKGLVAHYPVVQVVWARNVLQVLAVVILVSQFGGVANLKTKYPMNHVIRSVFQILTVSLFFASLVHIGLAEASALADTNPVLITLGAALFLGERLTRQRLIAVFVALIGALIILRPGMGVFTPAALLPLGCAVAYAGNALMTRKIGIHEAAWTSLFYGALFGGLITSLALPFVWTNVQPADFWRFGLLGVLGTGAQWAAIRAFSLAEAGVIAPFGYVGILFATFWGWALFDQTPDQATIVGALVIIGAGLYVWSQDRSK